MWKTILMSKHSPAFSLILLAAASLALTFGVVACNNNQAPTQTPDTSTQPAQSDQPQDQAAGDNLAPVSATQAAPANDNDSNTDDDAGEDDASYGQPVLEAPQPPPQLPEYSQPDCPGDGYLWTPGYWSYAPQGYYWVPGAWARPPEVGFLWTPGYWGFVGGRYRYNYGFWGRHIGYYGGVNYGFGYVGVGYQGGYWNGNRFNYNRSVNNVNITNVQVYNRTVTNTVVINNTTVNITNNRSSYNGPGGITRRPLPTEIAATREQRIPPMNTQLQHREAAAQNRQQFASVNKGRPAILAATKPIPEGKPIAPIIPARAAAASRPASQPNRSEPVPAPRAAAPPSRAPAPAPAKPAEPMRKTVEPAPSGRRTAPPAARTKPAPAPAERRTQSSEPAAHAPAAHPQPARPVATPPNKPAPKPETKPATPHPAVKQEQHPAAKPKTPPPPAKKEPPKETRKPD